MRDLYVSVGCGVLTVEVVAGGLVKGSKHAGCEQCLCIACVVELFALLGVRAYAKQGKCALY